MTTKPKAQLVMPKMGSSALSQLLVMGLVEARLDENGETIFVVTQPFKLPRGCNDIERVNDQSGTMNIIEGEKERQASRDLLSFSED
jgi:hypothetical protein